MNDIANHVLRHLEEHRGILLEKLKIEEARVRAIRAEILELGDRIHAERRGARIPNGDLIG
jgi:hypothetical protein